MLSECDILWILILGMHKVTLCSLTQSGVKVKIHKMILSTLYGNCPGLCQESTLNIIDQSCLGFQICNSGILESDLQFRHLRSLDNKCGTQGGTSAWFQRCLNCVFWLCRSMALWFLVNYLPRRCCLLHSWELQEASEMMHISGHIVGLK